jgi:hypothetical protein
MREEPALLSGSAAESPDQVFRPALEMLQCESRQQRRQILERFTKLGRADINGSDAAADNGRRKTAATSGSSGMNQVAARKHECLPFYAGRFFMPLPLCH